MQSPSATIGWNRDLQQIVDDVGARLERAAAVDDPDLRLQAYSPHYGPVDDTRLSSILQRDAPADAKNYVLSMGIAQATEPFRIPPNPELSFMARVGAPIRFQHVHLGYLWLIDADQSLTEEELIVLQEASNQLAIGMYRETLLHRVERGREGELLRDLFSDDIALREHAKTELLEQDFFVRGGQPAVLVLQPVGPAGATLGDLERTAVERTLESGRLQMSAKHAIQQVT